MKQHSRRHRGLFVVIGAIVLVAAWTMQASAVEIELPSVDVPVTPNVLPSSTSTDLPSTTDDVASNVGDVADDPIGALPDPGDVLADPTAPLDPVLDAVNGLLPGGGPQPENGGNGGGGSGGSGGGSTTTSSRGMAGSGSGSRDTGSPGGPGNGSDEVADTRNALATATILHAAGRALELAGPLAVPLLFGIAAIGFLIAVSARPARLLKGDRLPFRRSYRI